MKKILTAAASCLCMTVLLSCATTKASGNYKEKDITHVFDIPESMYQDYIDTSLVTTGNNFRLKKFLSKLKAGKTVYVAALGGSVTEGEGPKKYTDGYAYQFVRMLGERYSPCDGENIVFDNAGLSGTPSMLGLIRYQSDVTEELNHTPDLLIIEFAVNDDGSLSNLRAFEELIRKALTADSETCVIALYSAATYRNQAPKMKPIADYYGVPQVNVLTLVDKAIEDGLFTKEDYYADYVHPTKEGHTLEAECLMNLFSRAESKKTDRSMEVSEKSLCPNPFEGFERIYGSNGDITITAGSFDTEDDKTQSLKKTGSGEFPWNWKHTRGSESFVMDIKCRSLVIVYKVQGSWLPEKFGKAELYVDGVKKEVWDGGKAGGWNNNECRLVIDEEESALHTVEIRMAKGDEDKGFTIVAMGYTR